MGYCAQDSRELLRRGVGAKIYYLACFSIIDEDGRDM